MEVNPWLTQALLVRSQTLKKAVAGLSSRNETNENDFASLLQSAQMTAARQVPNAARDSLTGNNDNREGRAEITKINQIIDGAAKRHGVPAPLIRAVVAAESGYQVKAVSDSGAQGLMQLMPGTAISLGVANPLDPAQNIDGGVRYLRELLDRYQGDIPKALAAYNAGPANVDLYHGIPPFAETKNYINKIMDSLSL